MHFTLYDITIYSEQWIYRCTELINVFVFVLPFLVFDPNAMNRKFNNENEVRKKWCILKSYSMLELNGVTRFVHLKNKEMKEEKKQSLDSLVSRAFQPFQCCWFVFEWVIFAFLEVRSYKNYVITFLNYSLNLFLREKGKNKMDFPVLTN